MVVVCLYAYCICLYSFLSIVLPVLANKLVHNNKHLKNVGPIRYCEPPHAHSPDVASGTVARRLRIDVHDNADDDDWTTTTTRDRGDR